MVRRIFLGIVDRKARGQDHGAHVQFEGLRTHVVGHGLGLAGDGALHTFGADPAVDAAGRLGHRLILLVAQVDFLEALDPLFHRGGPHQGPVLLFDVGPDRRPLALFLGDGPHRHLPAGLQVLALEIAVDGDGRLPARGHRGDGDIGAGLHVAAGKDAFTARGLGVRVRLDEAPGGELDLIGLGDELQVGPLADGHDDHVGSLGLGLIFEISGIKAALFVEDPLHRLQFDAGDLAAFRQDLLDAPAVDDRHAFVLRPLPLPRRRRASLPGIPGRSG